MTSWHRLYEIRTWPANWDDEGAEPVATPAYSWATEFLIACEDQGIPFPRIFATQEGGILLEEQPAAVRFSLEVEPDGTNSVCIAGGGVKPLLAEAWDAVQSAQALGIFLAGKLATEG
jgi:hypothetical protein